jgi:hypothetical protein
LNVNYRVLIALLLVVLVGLPHLSIGLCGAQEGGRFVTVESVNVEYKGVHGTEMVPSGGKITIEVVLSNFSTGIAGDKSELRFNSDLDILPSIIVDGTPKEFKIPFVVDHSKVQEVKVILIGDAPEVTTRRDDVLLLNITQKVVNEYQVVEIRRTVSSEAIEDAIMAIADARAELERADTAIEAAQAQGLKVSEARISLELANEHLNNSQQMYFEGRPEAAVAEAEQAKTAAQEAEAKAAAAVGGQTYRNYAIIGVIIAVLLVVVVLFLQQRRRKRGVY